MPWPLSSYCNKFRDRSFYSSAVNMSQEVAKQEPILEPGAGINLVSIRKIDKILLVWSGKYKTVKDVPDRVSRSVLSKCHNVCRIKTCNYMIVATAIAAFFYAWSGKKDAEKGISIAGMNIKWHEEYNKKVEEEQKKIKNQ